MNYLQIIARKIIKITFDFSVWTIEQFYDMSIYEKKIAKLRELPVDSLGYDIAKCLDKHQLKLVPKFESHDLKHVLLEYEMTPVDEIRLQAFMFGNGNYTLPCLIILVFGILLLPDQWITFYEDFKKGRKSKRISTWNIEEYAAYPTSNLKYQLMRKTKSQIHLSMINLIKYGAFLSIISGMMGMLFCLPYLFSSNIADLIGAGLPFIGGSILTIGGLFVLSNLIKNGSVIIEKK